MQTPLSAAFCSTKCKAGFGSTSNLRKQLIKYKMHLKAEEGEPMDANDDALNETSSDNYFFR